VECLSADKKAGLVAPASPRGRVLGLVERFVVGDPKAQLVLPVGDGSEPLFKRMRRPNECIVEMRTVATRSFGFFTGPNTFAALFLEEVKILKEKPAPGQAPDPYKVWAQKVQKVRQHISDVDCTTDVEQLVTDR
jgi:hypothetical protein